MYCHVSSCTSTLCTSFTHVRNRTTGSSLHIRLGAINFIKRAKIRTETHLTPPLSPSFKEEKRSLLIFLSKKNGEGVFFWFGISKVLSRCQPFCFLAVSILFSAEVVQILKLMGPLLISLMCNGPNRRGGREGEDVWGNVGRFPHAALYVGYPEVTQEKGANSKN